MKIFAVFVLVLVFAVPVIMACESAVASCFATFAGAFAGDIIGKLTGNEEKKSCGPVNTLIQCVNKGCSEGLTKSVADQFKNILGQFGMDSCDVSALNGSGSIHLSYPLLLCLSCLLLLWF